MIAVDVDEVLRARWRATGLPTSTPGAAAPTAAEEVRRLGAVQAQEFEATLWSLGRRTGESREAVLAQFAAGDFVRTHALRQTWHFVHRDDLTTVQAATAHRVHRVNALQYRQEGLDAPTLAKAADVIARAVAERPQTRARLRQRLADAGIPTTGFRLGILLMWAELECLVVSGPPEGRQQTYVAWPDRAVPDRDAATVRLAERFFGSHGPATIDDFTAWSSLTKTAARQAVSELPVRRDRVDEVEVLWLGELTTDRWAAPQVELLNAYDEYVSGFSAGGKRWLDWSRLWRDQLGTAIGIVMVDGQLAGNWRRRATTARVDVEVQPLRTFSDPERAALAGNADAYGRFVGLHPAVDLRPAP